MPSRLRCVRRRHLSASARQTSGRQSTRDEWCSSIRGQVVNVAGVDPLDQLLNLRSHHREATRFNAVSLVTVLSVQPTAGDIERLVTSMVDVEARLVTGIRAAKYR